MESPSGIYKIKGKRINVPKGNPNCEFIKMREY